MLPADACRASWERLLGLAGGTAMVGPVISCSAGSHWLPMCWRFWREQHCSCSRSSSRGLPGLSVDDSTDHHGSHGQWESHEGGLIVVTFPFQCELCPFPARLSIKGPVPLHSPQLCVPLSPQLALSLPAAGTGAWFGREQCCAARAAGEHCSQAITLLCISSEIPVNYRLSVQLFLAS